MWRGWTSGWVPWVLALFGVGALIGTTIGGRVADAHLFGVLLSGIAASTVFLVALALFGVERGRRRRPVVPAGRSPPSTRPRRSTPACSTSRAPPRRWRVPRPRPRSTWATPAAPGSAVRSSTRTSASRRRPGRAPRCWCSAWSAVTVASLRAPGATGRTRAHADPGAGAAERPRAPGARQPGAGRPFGRRSPASVSRRTISFDPTSTRPGAHRVRVAGRGHVVVVALEGAGRARRSRGEGVQFLERHIADQVGPHPAVPRPGRRIDVDGHAADVTPSPTERPHRRRPSRAAFVAHPVRVGAQLRLDVQGVRVAVRHTGHSGQRPYRSSSASWTSCATSPATNADALRPLLDPPAPVRHRVLDHRDDVGLGHLARDEVGQHQRTRGVQRLLQACSTPWRPLSPAVARPQRSFRGSGPRGVDGIARENIFQM